MLKPFVCEDLARLKLNLLDPATGNDNRASSSKLPNDKGQILITSRVHKDSREGRLGQRHVGCLGRFSPLNTLEDRIHEETYLIEAHCFLDN